MENAELIKALKEDAEWAHANEWETPITLGDHLDAAADALEAADKIFEECGTLHTAQEAALIARAEAAEKRVKELEAIVTNADKCEYGYRTDCDYCENIAAAEKRAEEAEKERDGLRENFKDYVCNPIHRPALYCENRNELCVGSDGRCLSFNSFNGKCVCRGFIPRIKKEE